MLRIPLYPRDTAIFVVEDVISPAKVESLGREEKWLSYDWLVFAREVRVLVGRKLKKGVTSGERARLVWLIYWVSRLPESTKPDGGDRGPDRAQ